MTAYQTQQEGIPKLREWQDNDFDLARHESHMRLFNGERDLGDPDDGGPEEKA